MEKEKIKNPEEVEQTLEELRKEKQESKKKTGFWQGVGKVLAFPFVQIGRFWKFLGTKIHVPITAKTTIIFTVLFTIAISALDVFIVTSVSQRLQMLGVDDNGYILQLALTSVLLIVISIAVITALGAIASTIMMSPIRKIIKQIDNISADDLSKRIGDVDSQDELRELSDRINAMLDNLEKSFDAQKKFVSDASHELKTPISVIQGYSNLLQRWGKDDREILDEGVESIAREAENMKRIVEQLLFLAKMGKYMLKIEQTDLKQELVSVVEGYALVCKTHEVKLKCEGKIIALVDKNMFVECIRSLVDNAIKYSPENTVVSITAGADGKNAKIDIADQGIGISEDDLPKIFHRFYRCDKARTRDKNSSGLGLTICKSLVEMMNGTIEVSSVLGKGTIFSLSFPLVEKSQKS